MCAEECAGGLLVSRRIADVPEGQWILAGDFSHRILRRPWNASRQGRRRLTVAAAEDETVVEEEVYGGHERFFRRPCRDAYFFPRYPVTEVTG